LLGTTIHRVGPKGQIVIPKALRDELGIEPGCEVSIWRHEDHVALKRAGRAELRGRLAGHDLVAVLDASRRVERARET
jgi:AbrB family looped-hinge helix DNA binding protein